MRKGVKRTEEPKAGVPAYIVTFSDMITLLLTFFVMLLSMAQVRDPEMFNVTRDAFVNHINCYGLGMLSGREMTPRFSRPKIKHSISDPDPEAQTRTIDSEEEKLRRLFKKLAESMETLPSRMTAREMDFSVARVRFSPGSADLDPPGREFLETFADNLQRQTESGRVMLYVLGLAADAENDKDQWILSSMRAEAAATHLAAGLDADFQCPVFAWGGGPGGHWVGDDSPAIKDSHLLIAILRQDPY